MKSSDIIRRAARNLRRAKARTILTSLAIGVGAFTIAIALAAGTGGRAFTNEMIATSGDERSLTVMPEYSEMYNSSSNAVQEYGVEEEPKSPGYDGFTQKDIKAIQAISGVASAEPMLSVDPLYMTRGGQAKKFILPLAAKTDRTEVALAAGDLKGSMLSGYQAMIAEEFLKDLGFKSADDAIGKELQIAVEQPGIGSNSNEVSKTFTTEIVAVDRPSDTNMYYEPSVYVSAEMMRQMYEYQFDTDEVKEFYSITALLADDADIKTVKNSIEKAGYLAMSAADYREALLDMVNIAQWGLTGFGALAILASIFGIINTMYISVLERTQQIGLMKALGARRKDISKMFRYEAAWIGMLGGVIGAGLAYLVTLTNPMIAAFFELDEGTRLLRFNWTGTFILIASLVIVAVIAGYFPSRRAAKLDPIEALRTD